MNASVSRSPGSALPAVSPGLQSTRVASVSRWRTVAPPPPGKRTHRHRRRVRPTRRRARPGRMVTTTLRVSARNPPGLPRRRFPADHTRLAAASQPSAPTPPAGRTQACSGRVGKSATNPLRAQFDDLEVDPGSPPPWTPTARRARPPAPPGRSSRCRSPRAPRRSRRRARPGALSMAMSARRLGDLSPWPRPRPLPRARRRRYSSGAW